VSPSGSGDRCSPVTHQVYVVCSCRHALLDDPTRSSKEYWYIFTTTWKQASKQAPRISLHDWVKRERWQAGCVAVSFHLYYLIFSCCQFPLCELPKHTTIFRYRYDMQMYCTFVLFVNQHFLGLPASGTHCIFLKATDTAYHCKLP
jgi:hypothetical protein